MSPPFPRSSKRAATSRHHPFQKEAKTEDVPSHPDDGPDGPAPTLVQLVAHRSAEHHRGRLLHVRSEGRGVVEPSEHVLRRGTCPDGPDCGTGIGHCLPSSRP